VVEVRTYDQCQLITLSGIGHTNAGVEQRVVAPFDLVEPVEYRGQPRVVRRGTWRRVCRALIADDASAGALRTLGRARLDLFPHQLEPALAIVGGLGSRVLLADEVGLGKTLQAGLIVSELRARGVADRVLILTPSGLRDQWADELRERLEIDATIVDAVALRRMVSMLPVGVNPWSTQPISIVSVDYVKRPEVLPALLSCPWDIVVVDEAHGAAGGSDRHDAVAALASRAAYVVLLTATPHSGDRRAFLSLCGTGTVANDPLLVFRRRRRDVHVGAMRRVHLLSVRMSVPEARMHALLEKFTRAVRGDHGEHASLALSVLHKRALSSAHSLEQTVGRRLAALESEHDDRFQQLVLPLDDRSGELSAADEAPPWSPQLALRNVRLERQLLRALSAAAAAASRRETKICALQRLLRRVGEPAVVFTEYRDTLLHLERHLVRPAVLHGGLTRPERVAALEAFTSGRRTVLLATDAAGEGLNLHHACRAVVNLELPWNPMRLEQRIGRVDRIGQHRIVHAFHLVARETGEVAILSRLRARLECARADLGAPDPLGEDAEGAVRRLVIGGIDTPNPLGPAPIPPLLDETAYTEPRLAADAVAESQRVATARRFVRPGDADTLARADGRGPMIAAAGGWLTRMRLRGRVILLWRIASEDGCGCLVMSTLLAVSLGTRLRPAEVDRVLQAIDPELRRQIEAATGSWFEQSAARHRAFSATRASRERAIVAALAARGTPPRQGGLFDRRDAHARLTAFAAEENEQAQRALGLALLEQSAMVTTLPPRLLLVMTP
jgi:superfamily II DNA or RNA helicase